MPWAIPREYIHAWGSPHPLVKRPMSQWRRQKWQAEHFEAKLRLKNLSEPFPCRPEICTKRCRRDSFFSWMSNKKKNLQKLTPKYHHIMLLWEPSQKRVIATDPEIVVQTRLDKCCAPRDTAKAAGKTGTQCCQKANQCSAHLRRSFLDWRPS